MVSRTMLSAAVWRGQKARQGRPPPPTGSTSCRSALCSNLQTPGETKNITPVGEEETVQKWKIVFSSPKHKNNTRTNMLGKHHQSINHSKNFKRKNRKSGPDVYKNTTLKTRFQCIYKHISFSTVEKYLNEVNDISEKWGGDRLLLYLSFNWGKFWSALCKTPNYATLCLKSATTLKVRSY